VTHLCFAYLAWLPFLVPVISPQPVQQTYPIFITVDAGLLYVGGLCHAHLERLRLPRKCKEGVKMPQKCQ